MYIIKTINDDGFHKYVASMTGAAVKGYPLDDGVYKFANGKDCDRAVGAINKVYGAGIFTIVERKWAGEGKEPVDEAKKKEPVAVDSDSARKKAVETTLNRIHRAYENMPSSAIEQQGMVKVEREDITEFIRKTAQEQAGKLPDISSSYDEGEDLDLDSLQNIGDEYYAYDDSVGDFEVAPARRIR